MDVPGPAARLSWSPGMLICSAQWPCEAKGLWKLPASTLTAGHRAAPAPHCWVPRNKGLWGCHSPMGRLATPAVSRAVPFPGVSPLFVGSLGHAPVPRVLLSPTIPQGPHSSRGSGSATQHSPAGSQPVVAAERFGEASAPAEPGQQPAGGRAGGHGEVMAQPQLGALGRLGWFGVYGHPCSALGGAALSAEEPSCPLPVP